MASWLIAAFQSVPFFFLAFMAIAFFNRNLKFGGEAFMLWSFFGSVVFCALHRVMNGLPLAPVRWH
jgi:hypothetical protein